MIGRKVSVYRRERFNAAHRLYRAHWSDEKNDRIFGLCNNPSFHGHNYELEVRLTGVPDPETGFVIDLKELSDVIQEKVMRRFDHKNLNLDVKEFETLNPTAENITLVIYDILRAEFDARYDLKIRLYETPRNYAEYPST